MNIEDPRVIKTRENITLQFIECLKKYPFKDITIKMLISCSRINRSTFYRHFQDKYDLLNQVIGFFLSKFQELADTSFLTLHYKQKEKNHSHVRKLFDFFYTYKNYLLPLWDAALPVNLYNEMTNIMSERFFKDINVDYTIPQADAHIVKLYSDLFAATTLTTVRWWLKTEPSKEIDEIIKLQNDNIEKGLLYSLEDALRLSSHALKKEAVALK